MKRLYILVALATISTVSIFGLRNDFGLSRNIEIVVNIIREISENYVDDISPDDMLAYVADGLSRHLDPYSEYLSEEEMSSFEVLTTGKYGGIGSLIRQDGDYVMIAQPYEGSPADKAGLVIGDRIVAIDGLDAKGMSVGEVSSLLKGTPNSELRLTIKPLVGEAQREVLILRERISIPGIPYYGFVGDSADGIGYIQHSDFTDGVSKDMRAAIEQMRSQGLKALILDYRNNGGGILQEAVEVVSMFTPRATEVVTLKSRRDSVVYKTSSRPLELELPIVVLINENSASASEIVAGSLQDLDRAVLVGAKSFGKGLVQATRPVGYNSYLKMTTSKYYIPSGRCIQAIDYSNHNSSGQAVKRADSLRHTFYTKGGRVVYDGGGISPDYSVSEAQVSRFAATLYGLGYIDDFGDDYFRRHHSEQVDIESFSISDEEYELFKELVLSKDFNYQSSTRGVLKALKEAAQSDLYDDVVAQIEQIESTMKDDTQSNLELYRDDVMRSINSNIILRHHYQAGVIRSSILNDEVVERAIELLSGDAQQYFDTLKLSGGESFQDQ